MSHTVDFIIKLHLRQHGSATVTHYRDNFFCTEIKGMLSVKTGIYTNKQLAKLEHKNEVKHNHLLMPAMPEQDGE